MTPDIAFVGKAGAGKTTAAESLGWSAGPYRRLSFAKALKDMALQIWGDGAHHNRSLLQRFGVAMRDLDQDVWVRIVVRAIELGREQDSTTRFVVDDCRFPNEYHALRELGFVVVRITAPKFERVDRLMANGKLQDESQLDHISETAIDDYVPEYTIENGADCTKADLREAIRAVVKREQARV